MAEESNPNAAPVPLELFDEEQLPVKAAVVALARKGSYKHTGARALEDEKLCARIVECITWKWGLKRISRELHVSKWTVLAVMDALVANGDLAPYKQRMLRKMEVFLEGGLDLMIDGVHNGKLSAAQVSIPWGIVSDKRAIALGEPTSITVSGSVVLDQEKLSVQSLDKFFASLDSQSTGNPPKQAISEGKPVLDVVLDAGQVVPEAVPGAVPEVAGRGAGGSQPPTGAGGPTGSVSAV